MTGIRIVEQRSLMPARGNPFHGFNLAVAHDQGSIEVIDRGTDMPRKQIEEISEGRRFGTFSHGER